MKQMSELIRILGDQPKTNSKSGPSYAKLAFNPNVADRLAENRKSLESLDFGNEHNHTQIIEKTSKQ